MIGWAYHCPLNDVVLLGDTLAVRFGVEMRRDAEELLVERLVAQLGAVDYPVLMAVLYCSDEKYFAKTLHLNADSYAAHVDYSQKAYRAQ
jgi:hypothetical protein